MSIKKHILLMAVAGLFHAWPSAAEEALVSGYHLRPTSATVLAGGDVNLKLVYCSVENASPAPTDSKPDDELAPLVPTKPDDDLAPLPYLHCEGDSGGDVLHPLVSPIDVQWKVDGGGSVSGSQASAIYHAPSSKPTPNRVTVAVTFKYPMQSGGKSYPDAKQALLSSITILDEVKAYSGTFSAHDVSVNEEYTRNLTGSIRWKFDEDYVEGGWREYTGSGTASLKVNRTGCGTADFEGVPVEGRLKVHDDGSYEFLINLVGEEEQTRTCKRPELSEDLQWDETFSSGEDAVSSGDPCGRSEFYPRYKDRTRLSFKRNGACNTTRQGAEKSATDLPMLQVPSAVNRYEEKWLFKATE